jgi:hypothetical protein
VVHAAADGCADGGASAAVLGQVITAVEDFLDNAVWR